MQNTHAGLAVLDQRLPVALPNGCREQVEVAAKTEHTGRARTRDQIVQLPGLAGKLRDNAALQSVDVIEQRQVVTGPAVRAHEGPQGAVGLVEIDLELFEVEQAPD